MEIVLSLYIFNLKLFLYKRNAGGNGVITKGMADQWPAQLGIYPTGRYQTLTVLLMLCCTFRKEPSREEPVLWDAIPTTEWDRCRCIYPTTRLRSETYMEELGEEWRDWRGWQHGRPTVSTNVYHWELPKTRSPIKEQISLVWGHQYVCSSGLPWLALVGEVLLNPVKSCWPRGGGCPWWYPSQRQSERK